HADSIVQFITGVTTENRARLWRNDKIAAGHSCKGDRQLITKPTVMILGAGASMPYRFPSGEGLFQSARKLDLNALADTIRPASPHLARPLHLAVRDSLDQSLDAMLELRADLGEAGKAYMARTLLQAEAAARASVDDDPGAWYRTLWSAFDLRSIEAFRK